MQAAPLFKDLVLVGGGHTHVHVLKSFGLKPVPGLRLTLIGRDIRTPYSGMIPGFVAGHYTFEECHIDLAGLCAWAGARLIHDEATGIDRAGRQVLLKEGPAVAYDLLSIDVGSAPNLDTIPGAGQWATPVKPIADLGRHWLAFLESIRTWLGPLNIAVIGGGAGGVELALAIDHRLRAMAKGAQVQVTLATKDEILAGLAATARHKMRAIFQRRGLRLLEKAATVRIERGAVQLEDGKWLQADAVFVVTEASPAKWFAATGLPLDEGGFIAVDDTLRSTGDERVFAVGDCATVLKHRRPKAGVFAVRQGPPLARNLRRVALGEPTEPYVPQSHYLSIIGTGDGRAVATRSGWAIEGAWVWRWKDHIDRRWMRRYRKLRPIG
jgi:selenide,water dikinase